MESTMKKYARKIERNEINPHVRYDGKKSGLILNPLRENVPLNVLGFGIYRLTPHFLKKETKAKEIVLVPQEGEFEAEVNGRRFSGKRNGGPFALGPGKSNASALYIPSNSRLQIRGKGEMAFFEAPALKDKLPYYLSDQDVKVVSRGDWIWRRDVVTLITPKDASSNLVAGETWSPPGFWSGTPLHQHDKDRPSAGESDHEEVYYHRLNWRKGEKDQFESYAVQLLMDGKHLMKAYLIGEKSIFAIPGGCHPVVASPVSELLYLWGLAGKGGELVMRDIPEFAHLKTFEEMFKKLCADEQTKAMPRERLNALCSSTSLTEAQKSVLAAMLKEKGFDIE